jgi:hypothetical protein
VTVDRKMEGREEEKKAGREGRHLGAIWQEALSNTTET